MCEYTAKEEISKRAMKNSYVHMKQTSIFKDDKLLGTYPSATYIEKHSEELFGIKLLQGGISEASRNNTLYKGFSFKYTNK